VIALITLALIAAAAGLIALLAFAAVVLGIHATKRRHALRQPGYGRIDEFTRRLLGFYADPPRRNSESAEYDCTRR
jgi:hypothetical protein